MHTQEIMAYDAFLQSGKVDDYLKYIVIHRNMQMNEDKTTGEIYAYYDRRDCTERTRG